jgi:hypothetical protein
MDPASVDAAELGAGLVLVGASIVMALVAAAEMAVSVARGVTAIPLARDVSITVGATFDPEARAAVPDAGQVVFAATVPDLSVETILYFAAVPLAECPSWTLETVATLLGAGLMGSATTTWIPWVLAALNGAGMVRTEAHVGPAEPTTLWHAALEVQLAAMALLRKVSASIDEAGMFRAEASLSIRAVCTSRYLAARDVSLAKGRRAEPWLDA